MKYYLILMTAIVALYTDVSFAEDVECYHHTSFGIPGKADQFLCRKGFAIGFNYSRKAPAWVSYELTRGSVLNQSVARKNLFSVDREIPVKHRALLADYRGSGYDRGLLAPADAMKFSYESMKESFLLSNVIPQKPGFNRYGFGHYGAWGALEDFVSGWAVTHGSIHVVSGPVYQSVIDVVGNGIQVPSHFFKVIYDPEYKTSIAFLIPHIEDTAVRLSNYITTFDCIESLTGLDFLNKLDADLQADIENGRAYDFKHWSMRDGNTDQGSCPSHISLVTDYSD